MIRFRPVRMSLSASVKEEQTFSTMEEMFHFLHDNAVRMARYTGTTLPAINDIVISLTACDNPVTGYKNERAVMLRNVRCIGFCGE